MEVLFSDEDITTELVEQMVEPKRKSNERRRRSNGLDFDLSFASGHLMKSQVMGRNRRQGEEEEEDYDFDLSLPEVHLIESAHKMQASYNTYFLRLQDSQAN